MGAEIIRVLYHEFMHEVDLWNWLPWYLNPVVIMPISTAVTMLVTVVIGIATWENVKVSRRMSEANTREAAGS
jgi:hypothetical protein